jgi:preprotein translocase subunit YajC
VKPTDLLLPALGVLLLVFLFTSQRRRQRGFVDLQSSLAVGEDVVTTSGLYGTIIEIDTAIAVLEVGPGQRLRFDRRAIASRVPGPITSTSPDSQTTSTGPTSLTTPDLPADPTDPTDEK